MLGVIVVGQGHLGAWLAIASLGACQCAFDAGKLDRLACTSTAECAVDQDCIAGTCTERGCHEAADCGDPAVFECLGGFCEATGRRDAGAGTDAGADAGADAAMPADAGLDAGLDAALDAGADAGNPGSACVGEEADLQASYDHDGDPATPDVDLLEILHACALECVLGGGPDCPASCIGRSTRDEISVPCTQCLQAAGDCAFDGCFGDCFEDAHAPACVTCGCDNCDDSFLFCGGVSLPWCQN